jgi:hypothetical protein
MLNWFAKKQLAAFERRWDYDTSYMNEIIDEAGAGALFAAGGLQKLGNYRKNVPRDAYVAAKVTAARGADCGPCLQLTVKMAEAEGVGAPLLRALVSGDRGALSEDARLGFDLANATLARASSGNAAREAILKRWGRAALVSMAYAIVAAQAYPTLKYALGHGHACVRVKVAGSDVPVKVAAVA